ncbi:hypothetical protein CEXT_771821 [Caerostris extrusa]|uniref:Uncharacterized protein n=1 Tax=Caerostris extrusa TaxID=172846 RepID=A0AAV4US16_CAEEX|nr:hypothetical protein CEXT_771821 [Caerostris extrusa]
MPLYNLKVSFRFAFFPPLKEANSVEIGPKLTSWNELTISRKIDCKKCGIVGFKISQTLSPTYKIPHRKILLTRNLPLNDAALFDKSSISPTFFLSRCERLDPKKWY